MSTSGCHCFHLPKDLERKDDHLWVDLTCLTPLQIRVEPQIRKATNLTFPLYEETPMVIGGPKGILSNHSRWLASTSYGFAEGGFRFITNYIHSYIYICIYVCNKKAPLCLCDTVIGFVLSSPKEIKRNPLAVDETSARYQDLHNRSARIYVPLQARTDAMHCG